MNINFLTFLSLIFSLCLFSQPGYSDYKFEGYYEGTCESGPYTRVTTNGEERGPGERVAAKIEDVAFELKIENVDASADSIEGEAAILTELSFLSGVDGKSFIPNESTAKSIEIQDGKYFIAGENSAYFSYPSVINLPPPGKVDKTNGPESIDFNWYGDNTKTNPDLTVDTNFNESQGYWLTIYKSIWEDDISTRTLLESCVLIQVKVD